jgi:hypothetical protein
MGTNGYHRRRRSGHQLTDDAFSEALREQGDAGRYCRQLYLRPWALTYLKRVQDEPLRD